MVTTSVMLESEFTFTYTLVHSNGTTGEVNGYLT